MNNTIYLDVMDIVYFIIILCSLIIGVVIARYLLRKTEIDNYDLDMIKNNKEPIFNIKDAKEIEDIKEIDYNDNCWNESVKLKNFNKKVKSFLKEI